MGKQWPGLQLPCSHVLEGGFNAGTKPETLNPKPELRVLGFRGPKCVRDFWFCLLTTRLVALRVGLPKIGWEGGVRTSYVARNTKEAQ